MRLLFRLSINKSELISASTKIKLNHSNLPANKSIFAHFVLPWRAAFISGVKPKVFLASTSISGHLCRRILRHSVCPVRKHVTRNIYWHHWRQFSRVRYFITLDILARNGTRHRYYVALSASTFSLFSALVTPWNPRIGTKARANLALDRVPCISDGACRHFLHYSLI